MTGHTSPGSGGSSDPAGQNVGATKDEAWTHLRVEETASAFHIGVEDNGTGFNLRHNDRLFQLFGRLHSSKDYEGTGVGLVTVRRSWELFGGRVWAEGKVDEGSTFWFAWPKLQRSPRRVTATARRMRPPAAGCEPGQALTCGGSSARPAFAALWQA